MLRSIDDFYTWSDSYNINQTIFVPSATFLASLSDFHKTYINSEPGLIRKVSSLFFRQIRHDFKYTAIIPYTAIVAVFMK